MTTVDPHALAASVTTLVPFARDLGIRLVDAEVGAAGPRVVYALPDEERLHNHVGGPHAGALFTLGETASGGVVMVAFAQCLDRAVPLAVRADVAYRKLALGSLRAVARLGRPAAEVVAELDGGARPEFPVHVEVATEDGTVTAEMTVVWTLRPDRR